MDRETRKLIRQSLEKDTTLPSAAKHIDVDVSRGVVTLSGTVPTVRDRKALVARVAKLPGVDLVKDHLKAGRE